MHVPPYFFRIRIHFMRRKIIILSFLNLMYSVHGQINTEQNSGQSLAPAVTVDPILQKITDGIKTRYNAQDPFPALRAAAEDLLKRCGITRPIIILQSNELYSSKVTSDPRAPRGYFQEYMIIGTNCSGDSMLTSIYHEIGHIAAGDVSLDGLMAKAYHNISSGIISCGAMGLAGYLSKMQKKSVLTSIVFAGAAGCGTWLASRWNALRKNVLKEKRADIFAYNKMLEHGELGLFCLNMIENIWKHENIESRCSMWQKTFSGYPAYLERAKFGIDVLSEKGISLKQFTEDITKIDAIDPRLKEDFQKQTQKYFPELLK